MKQYSAQELHAFVGRADTHEKVSIAREFIGKLDYIDNELYDDLMNGLAYISRELYHEDRYTSSYRGDYGPSNPWDAPGMSVRDFI